MQGRESRRVAVSVREQFLPSAKCSRFGVRPQKAIGERNKRTKKQTTTTIIPSTHLSEEHAITKVPRYAPLGPRQRNRVHPRVQPMELLIRYVHGGDGIDENSGERRNATLQTQTYGTQIAMKE